ncbi:MAG: zf-HC2 domain-containing protein [Ktedonobacteraceae bacterium]|nr:zf-HC2 domain-containing protein [Ktedonobacteraceae bacterium]
MDRLRTLFARFSRKNSHPETSPFTGLACQEVVELVTAYLEDALLPEKRAQLEEHLAGCDGCTNYIEQVRLTIGMLRNLAQEPAFPETKEDLLQVFRQWKNQ